MRVPEQKNYAFSNPPPFLRKIINMKARLIPPYGVCTGNFVWNKAEIAGKDSLLAESLATLATIGYWASPYPEGDGITFKFEGEDLASEQMLLQFKMAFPWLDIDLSHTRNANFALADLAADTEIQCTIIVPLACIFIEETFEIGEYRFFCRIDCDDQPFERLGSFESEYLEFDAMLRYEELLRINQAIEANDRVVNKCLALAEHAMDIIRLQYCSFTRPEFTPNPAGQLDDGFYSIEIIPGAGCHLKPFVLTGISRPMSASNNWLGPEVAGVYGRGCEILKEVLSGRSDELGLSIKAALRGCRQSFYSLGNESKFLNLVFTLDGLAHPGKWTGWKHRTYLAALISNGNVSMFENTLRRYDELYTEVRNKLVHGGKDFYELAYDPAQSCEDIYQYIQSIIEMIESHGFSTVQELHDYALDILSRPEFIIAYNYAINESDARRGVTSKRLVW